MKKTNLNFKKGATSFYVVAFSTLLLTVIAASFAILIISEINRSSRADLSQSAYDSALAGVEDAKAAVLKYRSCTADSSSDSRCEEIKGLMEAASSESATTKEKCDVVGKILGRNNGNGGEIFVQESNTGGNDMQQAYTCVQLTTTLDDYRATLSASNPTRIVRFGDTVVSGVKYVRFSWHSDSGSPLAFANFDATNKKLPTTDNAPKNPPVISFGFIQTAASFTLDKFNQTQGKRTNRGTVFLVPAETGSLENNKIGEDILLASNNHAAKNEPQPVYCKNELYNGFACSALIKLPAPVDGDDRSSETFMLIVSLPYAQTTTDFAIELCKNDLCSAAGEGDSDRIAITGVQIGVDSTGRANDLYRRVETRIENYDSYTPMTNYAIQLLGDGSDNGNLVVVDKITSEHNF